jgi:hypothetical protein
LVQHRGTDAGTTLSSSLAFGAANTSGNWIAVVVRGGQTGQAFTVSDTLGNTYRRAVQYNETVDRTTLGIFYAESIRGGTNTVSVSNSTVGTLRFAILEYAGVALSNSLDVTSAAQGSSAAPSSGTATTTSSGDLLIGMLSTANPRTFTPGSGYVLQELVPAAPNAKLAVESRIQAAAGPTSATGALNASDIWGAALAAFRPAVSGGTLPPSISSLSPAFGPTGTQVTITGANFGTTQGTSVVTFNGAAANVATWTETSLLVTVPGAATTGPVTVAVNGVASNGASFTLVSSGSQPTAPGFLSATVTGEGQIDLSWSAATDDEAVVEYRVEQCQGSGCTSFSEIARVSSPGVPADVPLTASANPNYFKDGSGRPLILSGSHTWNNLQDWGTNGTLRPFDFDAFVNMLGTHGHNFTFLWYIELPKFCGFPTTATDGSQPDFAVGPHPWQRTGPGNATDGLPKFDLTKFNQAYFDRLRARVVALRNAGIYVGVYTFTTEWVYRYRCATDGYPFTGANNINGIDDGGNTRSFTMTSPNAITVFQDAYVEKVIDTLNDLPNVLWMISEEAPPNTGWWHDHQIAHIRSYESGKPHQHPIGFATPADYSTGDSIIVNSDADWIAPSAQILPTTSCGSGTPRCKVNVNDSDHSYFGMWNGSAQSNRNFAWNNFMTGNQAAFMDPYVVYYPREGRNACPSPVNGICSGPHSRWTNFRANLGYILQYSRKLNLANVRPQSSLCSTNNCLAQTPSVGAEYLIYAGNGGSFTVNLSAMSSARTLNVEWFNPSTGATIAADSVPAGSSSRAFTPPFSGDAVLYLVDSAGAAGAPSGGTPSGPATSYRVTGLAAGTYGYRVRAGDADGNLGPYSNVASATVLGPDPEPEPDPDPPPPNPPPGSFPPGLVAGYRLDEGTGTTTADISGNNTAGGLIGSPTWTTGVYGSALAFSGTNYVDLGNPSSLRLTGSMTLSAWINISENPWDDGAIVGKLQRSGWQLKTSPDTGVRTAALQISSNGADSIQRYSSTVLVPNTWYHLAGVYDAAARTLNVYVNGNLANGVLSGTVPAAQADAPFNVNIGQRTGYPGTFNFRGRIDEVHVFNRALSAAEVRDDMNLSR